MIRDNVKATGRLVVTLTGKDGKVKEKRDINNLVVDTGEAFIASRMAGTSAAVMSHMGVGSGTTAAAGGDTALQTAVGARVALSSTTVTANAIEYQAAFVAGASTGAITEAGIFNALTAGTMLCRTVFAVVNKLADDTLSITWTVTING
jgi:pyruvate/2-oxoacid:ferredoxin oxidoreductase beta subunit